MSINISDPINFIIDDSVDICLNQTQINNYLTPIYDTSTNPKFTWENNKNTGMYHPSLNTIAFSTDGNERLRIDANGNINASGIITGDGSGLNQLNASNVSSGTLAVSRGGTGKNILTSGQIMIGDDTDQVLQTSYLTWDNTNNRLGIGITNPIAKVDISNNTTDTIFKVNQLGTGDLVDLQVTNTSILKIDSNKNINMNNNLICTDAINNNVGIGTTTPTEKIHVLGNARIEGNLIVNGKTDIFNTSIANSEQLNITNDGTGPALIINQKGNEAIIEIKDDDEICLKVFDGGHVGFGTSTKIVTADISGNLNVSQTINSTDVTASNVSITNILNANMIDISNNSISTALKVNQDGSGDLIDLQDNGISKFKIDSSGNIITSTFYIDASTDFVGIGTSQPNTKLHVTGDTRIEGNLIVNGTTNIINTNVSTSEQLLITNDGTGPALIINQTGAQPILEIQDDSDTCFKIFDGGHVGMGTSTKNVNVDISGNIKSSGTITSSSNISSSGNISSSSYIIATGTGVNASWGNTRIGNVVNWGGVSNPTIGSNGSSGSLIMLDNPHITYKTDNIFSGRTFRAGIRCAANSSYTHFWDCGTTGYGFEILNSTLNNANTSCMTINSSGNIGIGNTSPIGPLCIGNAALANNDGFLVLEKCTTVGTSRHFRLGINAAYDFVIGDYGGGNVAGSWVEQFKVAFAAPANSLVINSSGHTTFRNVIYVGSATDSSTIFLGGGASGDGDYNNSVIETRNYASTENTELLLFKGNDAGLDRIRLRAGAIAFDTYPSASSVRTTENIRMYIDQNGNVGINTTTPREKLDVFNGNMVIRSPNESTSSILYFGTPFQTTSSWKSAIIAEGFGFWSQSRLHLCCAGGNDNTTFASTANARITILPSGNVGIGNTRPNNLFQVGNAGRLRISNDNTDYTLIGTIDTDASNNSKIVISGNGRVGNEGNIEYYSTNTGSHIWYTTNTNSERMRISSTGNVGIGKTNPQYKLDILGDLNLNGDFKINGVSFVNSVLVTPSYYSLFDRIPGPSTLTANYTFTSSNTFTTFKSGILNISYSGDVKSVDIGLMNATISIINIVTSEIVYTKVSSLLSDQSTKNYTLPSILDNIALSTGTYYATIVLNNNTQIDNNNYQTLKVLFFPDNNVSNGLYSINTKISYMFHKLNGLYDLPPDGAQTYSMSINNLLGNVVISTGTTTINGYTIPKGYQIWTVGTTGSYTIIAGGASGASYGSYSGGRGAVVSTTYNLTAGDKIIIAIGQKPKNQSSGGGGTFVTKYNGTGTFSSLTQHSIILVAGGGGGAGSGIVPGVNNVLDYLPGLDASFTTSGTRYNFKNSIYSSATISTNGGGGGGNGTTGGNLQIPDGTDAIQTSSGCGGGGFVGTGGDVDSTCTGGLSFLNGGIPGDNTWGGVNSTGAGFGGGGAGWYSGGGGGGYSGGQGANYNEQTGGGGGSSYDINTPTNNAIPYTLWLASSSYPPSSYVTGGYNVGDGFVLIEYDNGQLLGSTTDTQTKPFYTWSDDIDTGIYHPAANNIALTTNGTEKLRIDPSGNVGIGKTNPLYKLDIFGNNGQDNVKMDGNLILSTDGSSNYIKCGGIMSNQNGTLTNFTSIANNAGLCFVNSGSLSLISNSAERMRIDNNGNVGIGTTSISSRLHIAETTGTQAGANTGTIILDHNNNGGASSITFRSTVNRGSDYAYIQYQDASSVGAGDESARLIIGTQNNADDHVLLMPSGNVGINNTGPSYKLDVNGTFRATAGSKLTIQSGQDGGTGRGIMMWNDTDTNWGIYMGQSGGSRSLSGRTACSGLNFTQHAVRFRVGNSTTQGFIFENSSESCLLSIRSDGFSWLGGILNISDNQTNTFTGKNGYMSTGSLIIGSTGKNYGGGNNFSTNTAGFMMECADNTEIMIHDSNSRLASFMYYTGANNTFTIGRNAGWGISQVTIAGDINITNSCSLSASSSTSFYWNGTTSLLGRASAIGNYSTSANVGDIILKSANRLILQSGNGTYGIIIDTSNNVQMVGSLSVSGSISGNGSNLTSLNASNISSGVLSMSNGGIGTTTLTSGQLLIGNGTNIMLQSANLTWDNAINALFATNFIGSGTGLTDLNASNINSGTLNVAQGGIGSTTLTSGQLLIGNGNNALLQSANLTWDNSSNILSATSFNGSFVGSGVSIYGLNADNITTGTISVITGGTGSATLTSGQILIGNGTGALLQSANLHWDNTNNILSADNFLGSGANLTSLNASNLSSGVVNISLGGTGKTSLNTNQLLIGNGTNALFQSTNLSWDNSSNSLSATNFVGSGFGLSTLNASNISAGTLNVSRGGIGTTTLTSGQILIGNGANALLQSVNLSWNNTSNTLSATNFIGSGTGLTALNASNISSGTLTVSQGGIGVTTLTSGQILIGNGTNALLQTTNLSWNNTSNTLSATNFVGSGVGLTALNASNISSGTLTVSRGGIGTTTLTTGQILIGNGTGTLIQSANLSWNNTSNTLSATNFIGSGAGLSAINASNISVGTLAVARGGTGVTTSIGNGSVVLSNAATMTNGTFSGVGTGLTSLNASNISVGTLAVARGGTGVTTSIGNGSVVLSNAATMTNSTFSGTGTGLTSLNASNISLGTLAVARGGTGTTTSIGNGSVVLSNAATMTNGTFSGTGTGLTSLNASNISLGTLAVGRGGTGTTTSTGNGSVVLNNSATMTNGTFSGIGTGLSSLNAANITSGILAVLQGGTGTNTSTGNGSVVLSNAATMTNGTFSGNGNGLIALNATNITSGILSITQGGTGTNASTGNGSLVLSNAATITNSTFDGIGTGLDALNASNITSGILNVSQGGTGLNSITNNKLLIGNGTNSIIQSNNLHWDNANNRLGINVTNPTDELDVSGNVKVLGNIIPATNITYDLGSSTNRWRDLYLSGNSININNLLLKSTDGNLQIVDTSGNTKKLVLNELEFDDGTEKLVLTKNVNGKMILVRKDLSNNVLETSNIGTTDLATVEQLGIGVTQLNAALHILSTNNNNGLLLNHTNSSGNIINIQKSGTTKLKIDNSGNLFASSALYVDSSNNYVGICITNPSYNLHVNGPIRIEGDMIVNGTTTTVNTTIQNTDQLNITNDGTGTTIIANQTGAQSIVQFQNNGNTKFEVFSSGDVGIGKPSSNVNVDISGNLTVSGNINGSGSKLSNMNATNINSGILSVAYGGTGVTSSTGYGSVVLNTSPIITNGTFSGTGFGLTSLNADNINNGKLGVLYGGTGVNTSTGSGSVVLNTNPIITNGTFSGTGNGLSSLNASNISSGILAILQGGTGCNSLNSTYFDTSGNILSLKSSILNSWTTVGNNIYYNNGNIAIGKTNPSEVLDVLGNIVSSGTVKGNGLITTSNLLLDNVAGAAWQIDISNYILNFKNNNGGTFNNKLTLTNTGDFNVTGTISGNGSGLTSLNASNISSGVLSVSNGGTGLSNISTNKLLVGNGTNQIIQPSNLHWDFSNNRLGIGTTNPTTTLDVTGNINVSGSITGTYIGSGNSLTNLNISNVSSGILPVSYGGIGTTILTSTQLLVGNGTGALLQSGNLTWDNTNNILTASNFIGSGTGLSALNASNILSGTLTVSRGGIGTTTLTSGQLLIGNGSNTLLQSANLTWDNTTNTLTATNFVGSGSGLSAINASNISNGTLIVSRGGIGTATLTSGQILIGNGTNALLQSGNLTWDNTNNILTATNFNGSGASLSLLNASNIASGILTVSCGGIGTTTLTSGQILIGNGSNTLLQSANLTWNNATNTLTATNFIGSGSGLTTLNSSNITSGILNVSFGGTGLTSISTNKLLVGNGTNQILQPSNLHWDNTNNRLGIGTTNPTSTLDISGNLSVSGNIIGSGVALTNLNSSNINSGTLSISFGGTGVSSFTSNQILIGNGTNNLIQTPNLSWNNNSLGICKTNPNEVLDVSGNIISSGTVKCNNGLITSKDLLFDNIVGAAWQIDISNYILNFKNDNGGTFNNKLTLTNTGDFNVVGIISGNGSGLNSLNVNNITSGILSVSRGGTGLTSISSNKLLVGNGTSQILQPSNLHWDNTNNRLGIGTINPNSTLDVSGNITISGTFIGSGNTLTNLNISNVSTGTLSTVYGGTGCTSINNTHFDTGGGILKVKDNLISQWTTSGTSIYYNTGNIGIGITNPTGKLDISNNSSNVAFKVNQIGTGDLIDLQDNSISKFKIDANGNISTSVLYLDASNNYIGIGTTQPSKQLHITNQSQFDNNMTINGDIFHNKRLTITNSTIGPALLINQSGSYPIVEFQNNGNTTFKIFDTGDVGIGTSAKAINVDISGNIKASNVIRSNLFYVGNENSTYGILRVYNNNNDNCVLFINDTSRSIEGGSKTATLRNDGGALRLQSSSNKGFTIDVSGNVTCDMYLSITGSGSHANWGNTKIGNTINWNNLSYPTIGSDGISGSVIVIENPYIPYETNDIFTNRTFRAGIRCAGDISYNAYWDCGATAYGFEILNSALNTGTSSCITIKSNGNIGIGKTNPSDTLDISGNINLSGIIIGNGSGLNNLNASNINSGILSVGNGGTGLNNINSGSILIGNGTNPLVQTNNLIWSNNCLGIGKSNPSTTLDVSGNITVSGTITGIGSGLSSLNATNITSGILSTSYGGTGCNTLNSLFFDTTGGVLSVKNKAFNPWEIIGTNLNYDLGNVGIGKTNPSSTLDVSGNIIASGNIIGNINATNVTSGTLSSTYGGTGCSLLSNDFDTTGGILSLKTGAASQWIGTGNNLYYDIGNVGIGKTNPEFAMDVSGNINFSGSLYKDGSQYISSQWTTNNSDIYFNSGSVAIGKINPSSVLDISGNVLINGNLNTTGDIVANYSDDRLKTRIGDINNSLEITNQLSAFKYTPNEKAVELGIKNEGVNIGLSAQDVQKVLPEIVDLSPLDIIEKDGTFISKTGENYLSIKYERLVPILIENIKELHKIINQQSEQIKLINEKLNI